ncbi:putative AraC-family regulatory protein [Kitasatospora xanthocidica]|uniref:helix-turn-helix domain-containing protein n=1 Tax=Kitasatospora xanthocidica TaxID=83382 RepID=UPI00167A92E1|nr:helix-turn-helix domain-containing protein [Kitasatospora xanthocidica]GHF73067.1 putative AraC-family regulatory protein [Kitasatospora xanthocidica]
MARSTLLTTAPGMVLGTPAPPLRRYVLGYRGYRLDLRQPRRRLEVPTDVVTVALAFEGTMRLVDAVAPAAAASFGSVAAGLRRTATIAEHSGVLHGLAVSLTPRGAYRAFGPLAGDLGGQWAEAGDVLGPRLRALTDRLADTPSWPARFAMLDGYFAALFAYGPDWDPSVRWAWHQLRRSHGQVPVPALVEGTGWSRRRLELRFREHLGVAPKQAAGILRLQHTLALLAAGPDRPAGADLAALCGYYDQSHLDRSFRGMVGCSPRAFLASRDTAAALPDPTDRVAGRVTSAVLDAGAA